MLLALHYHACSSLVPGPECGGQPDSLVCMATRQLAGHKKTRGRQVTQRPQCHEDRRTAPATRRSEKCNCVKEEHEKKTIQKYFYTKHPWPILGKVCAWQGSCDSIYMYTHINPQHYILVKTTLDIPSSPLESTVPPGKNPGQPDGHEGNWLYMHV